jgi:hypothetical protein
LKPRFDEECFCFLDSRKQAKLQWVQDPSQSNVDNPNNVRFEASRDFREKKRRNKRKKKLRNFKLTIRSKILGTCRVESMTVGRVTSLELI